MNPIVDGIEQKYKRHIDLVYVSVDEPDGQELAREYGVIGTPTFLLLDSEGNQVNVLRGSLPAPLIEQAIEDLIAKKVN
jgi:thiol-disulfide isomerase/thioredoxin